MRPVKMVVEVLKPIKGRMKGVMAHLPFGCLDHAPDGQRNHHCTFEMFHVKQVWISLLHKITSAGQF